MASYQDVPLQRYRTSSHISISCRRPQLVGTLINARMVFPSVRLNKTMSRYMCHVCKLTGVTVTDMLVHFPASFSKVVKEMKTYSIDPVSTDCSLTSLSCFTSKRRRVESQSPRKTSLVEDVSKHFERDIQISTTNSILVR